MAAQKVNIAAQSYREKYNIAAHGPTTLLL